MTSRRTQYIILITVLATVFLYGLHSIADFDTGYHLQTGHYIVTHGMVPLYDIFSSQGGGVRWIAHYWLSDVFFFLVYALGGYGGLIVLVGAMAVLTWWMVMRTAYQYTGKSFLVPLLLLPYTSLTYELWVVRPQIYTYAATALLLYLLERWRRTENKKILVGVIVLVVVWANLHAGVILGIAIVGLYGIAYAYHRRAHVRNALMPLGLFLAAIAVTIVNPNGYATLWYEQIIGTSVRTVGTLEWKSLLYFLPDTIESKAFLGLMVVVAVHVGWVVIRRIRRMKVVSQEDIVSLGLLAGACALPLMSIRHVILFLIMTFPLFVMSVQTLYTHRVSLHMRKTFVWGAMGLVGIFCIGGLVHALGLQKINDHMLPVGAVQFIQDHHIAGPTFNNMEMGGYLIWTLWPQQKVLFDGRSEIYAGAANDNYVSIFLGSAGWQKAWDAYHPNNVLLAYRDTNVAPAPIVGNLIARLQSMGYDLVYWDDAAVLLLKDTPGNKNIIDTYAYHDIGPFVNPTSIPAGDIKSAMVEAQRALDAAPDSIEVQNFATLLLQRIKNNYQWPISNDQ